MAEAETVRAQCIFHGLVQGVFFRANARAFALELRIRGWVMNLPDGTVEAIFEGKRADVEEVIRRCREDQPYAKVREVDVTWSDATGEFSTFTVAY